MVLSHDSCGCYLVLACSLHLRGTPSQIARGATWLLQADRKFVNAIVHEESWHPVPLREIGTNANYGSKLGRVQHLNAVVNDLPECLLWRVQEGTNRYRLVAQH